MTERAVSAPAGALEAKKKWKSHSGSRVSSSH